MKQRGSGGDRPLSRRPGADEGARHRPDPAPAKPKFDKASANDQALDSLIAADKRAALKLAPISHETEIRLDRYIALLREWQAKTNLVAPSTLPQLWTRHIADSLQLVDLAPTARRWADLGSGGGFPGVVLACAMAGTPGASVHLVERIAKKAAFLREAVRVTTSPGVVHLAEIGDNVDRITGSVDCVTARALAPLHQLIGFAEPLMRQGAQALFPKGQDVEAELTEAAKYWNIQPQLHRSRTGDGWIVELTSVERRG
ncbi:16S rRNA (guanine(527)-N(7))-methyltransferase RsmG [Bradyrhizobium sp. INPA01-394B]|uniref:16S rRNA (guanine(527)-N(7))-methyltransferase RsmG n=1 Tax=Bradyrhizobium campsiandrae TaxID=1729892 RepID=UPI0019C80FF9|nr:16S rRNA (guanine(527)-N(7))-methyltransferase RsmG [Bradyrhizobium campsiandrae]